MNQRTLGKTIGWALVVLFGGILVVGFAERWSGQQVLRRALAAIEKNGETIAIAAHRPPRIPPESNAWAVLVGLTNAFAEKPSGLPPSLTAEGLFIPWLSLGEWTNAGGEVTTWSDVRVEIEAHAAPLAELRRALERPEFDGGFAYTNGFFDLPAETTPMYRMGQWLVLATAGDLHAPGPPVTSSLRALLRLILHQRRQPLIIAQLTRTGMIGEALQLTSHWLAEADLADDELRDLQSAWTELQPLADMEAAFQLERALGRDHMRLVEGSRELQAKVLGWQQETPEILGTEGPSELTMTLRRWIQLPLWRSLWVERDNAFQIHRWNRLLAAHRLAVRTSWNHAEQDIFDLAILGGVRGVGGDSERRGPTRWDRFRCLFSLSESSPFLDSSYIDRAFRNEVARRLAVTAVAVTRFHRANGRWPRDLAEMVPQFMTSLPIDPMDGSPLRFRASTAGYVLYSIGADTRDDGGRFAMKEVRPPRVFAASDWIFPSPQAPGSTR